MKKVRKKEEKRVQAFCLGEKNLKLEELEKAGRISKMDDTHWRIFSLEATEGEIAEAGDYIKLDSSGIPYPNSREFFLMNHKQIKGNEYIQIPQTLSAWSVEDEICPEIDFLIKNKGLVINKNDETSYFSAPLWGDLLTAAKDAVIVFYDIQYDSDYTVQDADFNFVARDEFNEIYVVIG